ncbi:hypothetical protein Q7P37_006344 [Cladosporium fusiforme]
MATPGADDTVRQPEAARQSVTAATTTTTPPVAFSATVLGASQSCERTVTSRAEGVEDSDQTDIPDDDQMAHKMQEASQKNQEESQEATNPTETPLSKKELKALRNSWAAAGKPVCTSCGKVHPPPCNPELAKEIREREELRKRDPDQWARDEVARQADRRKRIDEANAANRAKQQTERAAKPKVDFRKSVTTTLVPWMFCYQCLIQHPFPDDDGTHHTVEYRAAVAVHEAIAEGAMPKVDPWAAAKGNNAAVVQAALESQQVRQPLQYESASTTWEPKVDPWASAKEHNAAVVQAALESRQVRQPLQYGTASTTWEPSDEERAILWQAMDKAGTPIGAIKVLCDALDREDEAIELRAKAAASNNLPLQRHSS